MHGRAASVARLRCGYAALQQQLATQFLALQRHQLLGEATAAGDDASLAQLERILEWAAREREVAAEQTDSLMAALTEALEARKAGEVRGRRATAARAAPRAGVPRCARR